MSREIEKILLRLTLLILAFGLISFFGCLGSEKGNDDDTGDDDSYPTSDGFVPITHGTFTMGSPADEPGRSDDEAEHKVTLSRDYEMMATEVTQGGFEDIMGYNPSYFPVFGVSPMRPVEQVSWYDALAYSNKLSKKSDYKECYLLSNIKCADDAAGNTTDYCKDHGGIFSADVSLNGIDFVYECEGYRLPTESEWEYAARAGTKTAFYSGAVTSTACFPLDPNLNAIAWYCANARKKTHHVASRDPNAWGLYDMSGNAVEWVWDWYANDYPGDVADPQGPSDGHFRVIRGGSFRYDGAGRCRSAHRAGHAPGFRSRFMGFRLVRTLSQSNESKSEGAPNVAAFNVENNLDRKQKHDYPDELPFEFTREDVGVPLTPEEVTAFTKKITGFWKQVSFFHWLLWHGHGMDASNPDGMPDYKLHWQDVQAIKNGDVVTFEHRGFADNLTIGMSKLINNAIAGYLLSGDETLGRVVEQYSKGYAALFKGMLWDENDPEHFLLARTIFTKNHSYTEDGRQAYVNYDPVKHEVYDWNSHTIPNPNNPYWGNMWVRNMRSKDDICHIYRVLPMLMRVVEDGKDEYVREAAAEALKYLQGFARDVVDSGYYVRTKDKYGNQFVPLNKDGTINDLASFVNYDSAVPKAECNAKLASALIGYGDPMGIDCESGYGNLYELIATKSHYYNYEIIRYFHVSAITNALMAWQVDVAKALLYGMAARADATMDGEGNWENTSEWYPDAAAFILAAATAGLPLTSREARLIMEQYSAAADHYVTFPNWDLWSPSVPDGEVQYMPSRWSASGPVVDIEDMTFLLEYCYSPFRNPTGADLVDCDVIADPEQWGE